MPGRPSKYKETYCTLAMQYMAKGYSIMALAGKIGISRDTIYEWCRKYPQFSDTIKKAKAKEQLFWEELGMKALSGETKNFPVALWIYVMKSRFGWRDDGLAQEDPPDALQNHEGIMSETPDETIKRLLKKYGPQLQKGLDA